MSNPSVESCRKCEGNIRKNHEIKSEQHINSAHLENNELQVVESLFVTHGSGGRGGVLSRQLRAPCSGAACLRDDGDIIRHAQSD